MAIQFYNTLTKQKEKFIPIKPRKVNLYTCGPTVYDAAHIGNFRTFIFEDLLKRYLIEKGFKVHHVMNITDVDDKTILRSNQAKIPITELTESYIDLFFNDLKLLKIIPADKYPKATDHISEMITLIQKLLKNNFAYLSEDNSVYFKIKKFKEYGKLAKLNFAEQKKTQRITADDYSKDNPQDFVLWKAWKTEDGNICWESPWGKGRPGWHIECSAMSTKYLGTHFDIHCGGVDNIFPHHENEIAQSECANNGKFVNFWLHSEHLLVDNVKMSKSAGNFYKINDLVEAGFSSEALRYLLLSGHYRTKINFSLDKKHEAIKIVQRVNDFRQRLLNFSRKSDSPTLPKEYSKFIQKLDDDLNTPEALAVFFDWLRTINIRMDNNALSDVEAIEALNFVDRFNSIFDLIREAREIPHKVQKLIAEREKAREEQNWSKADLLREKITKLGWIIEDHAGGYNLKPIK